MRSLTLGLVLGTLFVFAAQGLARSEEEEEEAAVKPAVVKALQKRVVSLEAHIQYLRSREEALTRYVLANETRAAGLDQVVRQARTQGFENRSIPAESRVTLLAGMGAMARSLRSDLPKLTRAEGGMLRAIQKAEAAAKRK